MNVSDRLHNLTVAEWAFVLALVRYWKGRSSTTRPPFFVAEIFETSPPLQGQALLDLETKLERQFRKDFGIKPKVYDVEDEGY